MNLQFQDLLPAHFDPRSRVWIYQSSRLFTLSEALHAETLIQQFVEQWNSHGVPVKGYGNLFFGQFIVLIADETGHGVSGCSTDSSVRLIKEMERMFGVNMFDRMTLAFLVKDRVQLIPLAQLSYALENGFIDGGTHYFNNTVPDLAQLKTGWLIPVRDSWLGSDKRYTSLMQTDTTRKTDTVK